MNPQAVARAAEALGRRLQTRPAVHLVLGSGLSGLADLVEDPVPVDFRDLPGFPAPTVEGHAGRFVSGRLEGVPVLVQAGRFHLYEGHDPALAAGPVRVGHRLGARTLIVTNAAGGIRRDLAPGSLMLLDDHIQLQFRSSLRGPVHPGEGRFPDMSRPYDPELGRLAGQVALDLGIHLTSGTYAAVLGPSYETPAEIRMLERMGADAVGMSTVPEVVAARALGTSCLGISLVTNLAAGRSLEPLDHAEVVAVGREAGRRLASLLRGVLARLSPRWLRSD